MGGMMKIVDAQVHVWLPESIDRPWPRGGAARAQLPYALDCSKLLAMMNEAGSRPGILVPPPREADRNNHAMSGPARRPATLPRLGGPTPVEPPTPQTCSR